MSPPASATRPSCTESCWRSTGNNYHAKNLALVAVRLYTNFVNVRLLWINFIPGLNFIVLSLWLNE